MTTIEEVLGVRIDRREVDELRVHAQRVNAVLLFLAVAALGIWDLLR